MTISKTTAKEVAAKLYSRIEATGCDEPLIVALGVVEDIMTVAGNKSFRDSIQLVHKAVKDYYLEQRK